MYIQYTIKIHNILKHATCTYIYIAQNIYHRKYRFDYTLNTGYIPDRYGLGVVVPLSCISKILYTVNGIGGGQLLF